MGLTGSPPTFQCLVEKVLVGLTWKICVPYLDDNIIFSSTPEEHLQRLRLIFERFRVHNLKNNPEVDPNKMEAVQKIPVPKSHTEVKSFLGLFSYYRGFVPKFAEIASPLHKASETSTKFEWTSAAQDAFQSLKLKLTSTPILAVPCRKDPFILYTDASHFVLGNVLAQVQDDKERSNCYASQSLEITTKVLSDTPLVGSPCNFHTSFPPLSIWSKVHNSN